MPINRLKTPELFRFLNLIGFVLVLGTNYLANSLPLNGLQTGQISDFYPNLFVPAGRTFAIWGVIYLLMAGFVLFPFFSKKADIIQRFGWYFASSCLANAGWLFCWHYRFLGGSLICMLTLLMVLTQMYRRLGPVKSPAKWPEKVWINGLISIYLAWICVATIANVTTVLVHTGWSGLGLDPLIWTIVLMCIATALGGWFVWRYQDLAYAGVMLWALYGIYSKQTEVGGPQLLVNVSQGLMILLILSSIVITVKKRGFS